MANSKFVAPEPINEAVKAYRPGSAEKIEIKSTLTAMINKPCEIRAVINGVASSSGNVEQITSPHQHKLVLGTCQKASSDDVAAAINAAVKARPAWAALPWEERASIFLKAADRLASTYRSTLNAATILCQSKTIHQAEIDAACELIDFFRFNVKFAEKIYSEQPLSSPGMWNRSEARGLEGFVFAVTPFNFTSIAVNLACAPALMGCTVVWKPAMSSVMSSYVGFKLLEECGLPPGVINFVPSDPAQISNQVLKHPELAGIHFTGSTATFNLLWQEVGKNISQYRSYPRLVGETGGKDFVFAHTSADVGELAVALVRGAFEYQGQKCSAASRAYIPKSIWPKLRELLVDMTRSIKQGDPTDFRNFMGAVIDRRSYTKIKQYIDLSRDHPHAKILVGGECDDREGFFIRPTIIEVTDPKYVTMVEEIFGPVLTVYVYPDDQLDEALDLCDRSSPYALTGAIFAKDRHVIHRLNRSLENAAGNFYINDKPTGAVVGQQPFGGARASGTNDKAGSIFNLLRWTNFRTIKENYLSYKDYRYPFMDEG